MTERQRICLVVIPIVVAAACTLLLLGLLSEPTPVQAAPVTLYVSPSGDDVNNCSSYANRCRTVQRAIDVAGPGDEILVATGIYTPNGQSQVAYVDEEVIIRGGYSGSFDTWDPDTYPTTLDGQAQGRVVSIAYVTATLESLWVTNGVAEYGGGILASGAQVTISGCHVFSNTATNSGGGGIRISDSDGAQLIRNHIYSNVATGTVPPGGGIHVSNSANITLTGNQIYHNSAIYGGTTTAYGGGIFLHDCPTATLTGNWVYSNTVTGDGGGGGIKVISFLGGGDNVALADNHVYLNTAHNGGGLNLHDVSHATLSGNHVYSNTARSNGGGMHLSGGSYVTLTDNIVYSNTAISSHGGGIVVADEYATLTGNTVYSNTAGSDGGGISVWYADHAVLNGNEVYNNTANKGGGMSLDTAVAATLTGNDVYGNRVSADGGGVHVGFDSHAATLTGNRVYNNTSADVGGGVQIFNCDGATLRDNQINDNTGTRGGGVNVYGDNTTLSGNAIYSNTATSGAYGGGGVFVSSSSGVTLTGNTIYRNSSNNDGGGIYFRDSDSATLVNNIVAENLLLDVTGTGAGIHLQNTYPIHLLHTTIARNTGGGGQGVYVTGLSSGKFVTLANTVLVSHAVGIETEFQFDDAVLTATLWGTSTWANEIDWVEGGSSTILTGTINLWEDPAFVNPAGGDYHIAGDSGAVNAGVDAGVATDIDGDSRILNQPPDLGADEATCLVRINDDPTLYGTVQAAVDVASTGDVVKVAGTCQGVQTRGTNDQVVYITETLTVRGGYSADFATWDPQSYPTTLDALGQGRVVYAQGSDNITVTLQSLRLTNGSSGAEYGGGVHAYRVNSVISGCQIYSNTGSYGGGLMLWQSSESTLTGNEIYSNTASSGGGLATLLASTVVMVGNEFRHNSAINSGGAIWFHTTADGVLVNNLLAENRITGSGHGTAMYVQGTTARMLHTTIARNTGGTGNGIYLVQGGSGTSVLTLTNTILVSHTTGIYVNSTNRATLITTLWGSGAWANGTDWAGGGTIISTTNIWDDPAFVDPGGGDYHITSYSGAVEAGIDAGVTNDIDGDPRPFGAPDLGADEIHCLVRLNGTYYDSVQAAVDASSSSSDVIQVAGTCVGVETHASSQQVAYITKTLTIRGGYSGDFASWDPQVYPTTLDAQGQGQIFNIDGLGIPGLITPTLESLRMTNGWSNSHGGGIYARYAHITISGCHIYSNTAGSGSGGGIFCDHCDDTLLAGNELFSNTATGSIVFGGGAYFDYSDNLLVENNHIFSNTASSSSFAGSGGIHLRYSDNSLWVNNMIVGNDISGSTANGAGLSMALSSGGHLLHTTVAGNQGGSGQGLYLAGAGTSAWLTNTILAGHTMGVEATSGTAVTLTASLWGGGAWTNGTDWTGAGTIVTGTFNWWGDPVFLNPAGGDYHLGVGSAAVDRGLPTWVSSDIDGDPRSFGPAPDLGADEGTAAINVTKSGPAWLNWDEPITYTLRVTNTGVVTASNATLADIMPNGATYLWASDGGNNVSGMIMWPSFAVPPIGGVVTRTFTVKATSNITNHNYVVTVPGLSPVVGTVAVTTLLNHDPVANAGTPQNQHTGTVFLNGSSSADPDEHTLSYLWEQTDGPATVALNNADTAVANFTAPVVAGTYTFTLTITDTYSLSDSDITSVTITNDPPVADAGAPQSAHGGTVALNGSGSYDPDSDALVYGWEQTGGTLVALNDASIASPSFTAPLVVGDLSFQLTITDTFGATSSDMTTVTITNTVPVADAGTPQSAHSGTATLVGSSSYDPDGDSIIGIWWTQTGGTPVSLNVPWAWEPWFDVPTSEGVLSFSLTITDTFGASSTDLTAVTITNTAPVADAGAPQTAVVGAPAMLDGSGSFDPDSDGLTFGWEQIGGTPVALNDTSVVSPTFTAPSAVDDLTFQLTVTDTFGASSSDYTTVTVGAPVLAIAKSGPAAVEPGDPILYTLTVSNNASVAASLLLITDTLPIGASFVSASTGGLLVNDVVSWTVPTLDPMSQLTRTFTVTATQIITNADFGVSCFEGTSAMGSVPVVTSVASHVYLPLMLRSY